MRLTLFALLFVLALVMITPVRADNNLVCGRYAGSVAAASDARTLNQLIADARAQQCPDALAEARRKLAALAPATPVRPPPSATSPARRPADNAPATAAQPPAQTPTQAPAQTARPSDPAAALQPGQTFQDCPTCPEMVVIPAGSYNRGSPPDEARRNENEGPVQSVTIARFAVSTHEITVAEWRTYMAGTIITSVPTTPPSCSWDRPGITQDIRHPVVCIDWSDAQLYVRWLSTQTHRTYRFLSEAEWEYVARAGSSYPFVTGAVAPSGSEVQYVFVASNRNVVSRTSTAPVGSFSANRLGLYDVQGNVREWVMDCYFDSYVGSPRNGAAWLDQNCPNRIVRGGGWRDQSPSLRFANRVRANPGTIAPDLGLRIARDIAAPP